MYAISCHIVPRYKGTWLYRIISYHIILFVQQTALSYQDLDDLQMTLSCSSMQRCVTKLQHKRNQI